MNAPIIENMNAPIFENLNAPIIWKIKRSYHSTWTTEVTIDPGTTKSSIAPIIGTTNPPTIETSNKSVIAPSIETSNSPAIEPVTAESLIAPSIESRNAPTI